MCYSAAAGAILLFVSKQFCSFPPGLHTCQAPFLVPVCECQSVTFYLSGAGMPVEEEVEEEGADAGTYLPTAAGGEAPPAGSSVQPWPRDQAHVRRRAKLFDFQ